MRTLAYSILMFALLCLVYPPRSGLAVEQEHINHWLGIYVGMALMVTGVGASFSLLADRLSQKPWLKGLAAALLTLTTLALYALMVGSVTAQTLETLPFEALHGVFFREFRSIKFAFIVAPCAAVFTLILTLHRNPIKPGARPDAGEGSR